MKAQNILFVLLIIIYVFSCENDNRKSIINVSVLKGTVVDRGSDTLFLLKATDDPRQDIIDTIPIINGKFEHKFVSDEIEMYQLIFKDELVTGSFMPTQFFSENADIVFNLYDQDNSNKFTREGGENNNLYQIYLDSIQDGYNNQLNAVYEDYNLFDSFEKFNSKEYNELFSRLREAKSQEEKVPIYQSIRKLEKAKKHRSEIGKELDSVVNILSKQFQNKKYEFIEANPSLVSYSILMRDMQSLNYSKAPKEKIVEAYNTLSAKYPNHPYSKLAQNLWIGYTELQPGGQYINFKAPDINNVAYELKPIVDKNKIVLLDLWATWCGPCIVKSRKIRPVYEKYKDKGFTIVGVAGEFKNLNAYNKFMDKEQWPWLNLIELDRQNKIWEKYNVMNGGGGMFLIDGSGEILAVDPTAEEVEAILKDKLVNTSIKL